MVKIGKLDYKFEMINYMDLKFFRIAKVLNEKYHEELKSKKFHLRGNLFSFSLVSVAKETAEKGMSGFKKEKDVESYIFSPEKLNLVPPKRNTPEKELQAWIINYAMNNGWILPFGDNLRFITSELVIRNKSEYGLKSFKRDIRNDILAIDTENCLCVIELKSSRSNEVKDQTLEFEKVIKSEKNFFNELVELIAERKWNGKCRKIAVWPKSKTGNIRLDKDARYKAIEELNYMPVDDSRCFCFE